MKDESVHQRQLQGRLGRQETHLSLSISTFFAGLARPLSLGGCRRPQEHASCLANLMLALIIGSSCLRTANTPSRESLSGQTEWNEVPGLFIFVLIVAVVRG